MLSHLTFLSFGEKLYRLRGLIFHLSNAAQGKFDIVTCQCLIIRETVWRLGEITGDAQIGGSGTWRVPCCLVKTVAMLDKDIPLSAEGSKVSYSLLFVQLWANYHLLEEADF